MSIVELSATVDKLARIINQKNKELEELKQGYDQKLHVINNYIRTLEDCIGDSSKEAIDDEDFVKMISSNIECPNCKHSIWNNSQESGEYILLPRHQLKHLIHEPSHEHEPTISTSTNTNTTVPRPKKHKNKSKINCSFCGEPGHTRAKCNERLTTPIKDNSL
ncbi:hypothetical protein JA1_001038 [Spathaspora sp. JA1]|nr:hypothetical protein JA1_001038 [Spathaspora sp. JA1]